MYQFPVYAPVHFFSFERYAQAFGHAHPSEDSSGSMDLEEHGQRCWLYSVFGYTLPQYVVTMRYWPSRDMEFLVLPRPVQFPW